METTLEELAGFPRGLVRAAAAGRRGARAAPAAGGPARRRARAAPRPGGPAMRRRLPRAAARRGAPPGASATRPPPPYSRALRLSPTVWTVLARAARSRPDAQGRAPRCWLHPPGRGLDADRGLGRAERRGRFERVGCLALDSRACLVARSSRFVAFSSTGGSSARRATRDVRRPSPPLPGDSAGVLRGGRLRSAGAFGARRASPGRERSLVASSLFRGRFSAESVCFPP